QIGSCTIPLGLLSPPGHVPTIGCMSVGSRRGFSANTAGVRSSPGSPLMADRKRMTELLIALRDGDRDAFDQLLPLVYDELRAIARRKLRSERSGHTLDTS